MLDYLRFNGFLKMVMEFEKVEIGENLFYWTWKDLPFLPYSWLEEKDLKDLPKPFFLIEIHPDCHLGFETNKKDEFANILELPDSFGKLKLDKSLRKDLRRVEKKNIGVKIIYNEKDALDKSKKWFLEFWGEDDVDFQRRLRLWKEKCYTLSAYFEGKLIAVHIAMKEEDTVFYFGCWWDRKYCSLSTPIFLLKKDIERAISEGMRHYDLGIGDEPYKKKWGAVEKPTKYYAIITKQLADYLGVKNYVEMEEL